MNVLKLMVNDFHVTDVLKITRFIRHGVIGAVKLLACCQNRLLIIKASREISCGTG